MDKKDFLPSFLVSSLVCISLAVGNFFQNSYSEKLLKTEILTPACIKPLLNYHYLTCDEIVFKIENRKFTIPSAFQTDLASIPKIAWGIISPAHSALIRAAIIHDWFYRQTCDFTRFQTDVIFYHMLRNEGMPPLHSSILYYAVRMFGRNSYNEDYCDDEFKRMDKKTRGFQLAALFRHEK